MAPDIPLRFAISGTDGGDCIQMAALAICGQAKTMPTLSRWVGRRDAAPYGSDLYTEQALSSQYAVRNLCSNSYSRIIAVKLVAVRRFLSLSAFGMTE